MYLKEKISEEELKLLNKRARVRIAYETTKKNFVKKKLKNMYNNLTQKLNDDYGNDLKYLCMNCGECKCR